MSLFGDVDWDKVEDSKSVLPEGDYNFTIVKAEVKDTKSGGQMIALQLKVEDGEHEGRFAFTNLNHKCANDKAEKIALAQIKTIFTNNGMESIDSAADLVGLSTPARVKVVKNDTYGDQNNINFTKKKVNDGIKDISEF